MYASGSDRDLTAIRVEALIMDYLRHSLGSTAQAMAAIQQLKDHRDQRTPADHIRGYLTLADAEIEQ